jgi:hypothetical protein
MKKLASLLFIGFIPLAHAQLIVPKGTQAQLKVEYSFVSKGQYFSPSKDQRRNWDSSKTVRMTATYTADAPQPLGVLHAGDPKQKQDMATMQAAGERAQKALTPGMNDMMKLVQECGGADTPAQQACIEKKVSAYANTNRDQLNTTRQAVAPDMSTLGNAGKGANFQLWKLASQSGQYQVSEQVVFQVFELTCTDTKKCIRTTVKKGSGDIPSPPGASVAGASMFEVGASQKDLVLRLPVPLAPIPLEQDVSSTIAGDKSGKSQVTMPPWMAKALTPMTIAIAGGALRGVSGTKIIDIPGPYEEGGKLTVSWSFTAP